MERDGIKIDRQALNLVKDEYTKELEELDLFLNKEVTRVMGDMPINLSSPDDRSKLLFSRSINNKKNWIKTFNLGYEVRGNTKKPKRRAYMTEAQFKRAVVNNTTVQQKSEAQKCTPCNGYGKVAKKRKDGTWGNARFICKSCSGVGIQYMPTGRVAGFKLTPLDPKGCSTAGFKTDADALYGGAGDDKLCGNEGDNTLDGGTGKDTITSGGGSDTIVVRSGDGSTDLANADVLTDFTDGSDVIGLDGLVFGDLSIDQGQGDNASNVIIKVGLETLLIIEGVQVGIIGSPDFNAI